MYLRPFDSSGDFHPVGSDGIGGVRQLAIRGAGVTIFSGGLTLAIQVVATAILGRLLTPGDFGIVTMVTTFSLLLMNFGMNGLTEAIVQCDRIDRDLASTLFWINLVGGCLLTVGFAAAGSLLARLYKEPKVEMVAAGISLTIIATSLSVVHLALLKRAMRFRDISVNDIRARLVSVFVSIALGWAGWGYWALVAGALALPLSVTIGSWLMCRWAPGPPRRAAGTGLMLTLAFHAYGSFSVNYLSRNADNLLVGWRFDARSLGFYKKAYDLFALSATQLVSSITVIVVAALSRVNKDAVQYHRYLLGALTVMAFIGMGLSATLTLVGKDLIRLLLGPGWEPSERIFTFFGPGVGAMILYYTHSWIHLSAGRADRWFRWSIIEFIVTCVLFIAGLSWGPIGVAAAWSVSFWILAFPALWYAGRPIGLRIDPIVSAVWKYVLSALIAGSITGLLVRQIPSLAGAQGPAGAFLRVMVVSFLVVVLYLAMVVLLHGGYEPLYQVTSILREMIPRSKFSAPEPALVGQENVGQNPSATRISVFSRQLGDEERD